jgi:RNase P/RNase MRP subunit p30
MELVNGDLKEIRKVKNKNEILVRARDEEFNRKVLELGVGLVFPREDKGKDNLKQLDSGLNHVLCKIARDLDVKICLDMKELLKGNDFEISNKLARLRQNIFLMNKYKNKFVLTNCSQDKKDLQSFLLTLGANTRMAKYAVDNCLKI